MHVATSHANPNLGGGLVGARRPVATCTLLSEKSLEPNVAERAKTLSDERRRWYFVELTPLKFIENASRDPLRPMSRRLRKICSSRPACHVTVQPA